MIWIFEALVAMVAVFLALVYNGVVWVVTALVDLVCDRDKPVGS